MTKFPNSNFKPIRWSGIWPLVWIMLLSIPGFAQSYYNNRGEIVLKINPEQAIINKTTARITAVKGENPANRWIIKKPTSTDESEARPSDIAFQIKLPEPGIYYLRTKAVQVHTKKDAPTVTRYVKIQIDNQRITKRILLDSYNGGAQVAGKFEFSGKDQKISFWLPDSVGFGAIEFKQFIAPPIPELVKKYQPAITPPASRPRLWVTQSTLSSIKQRLSMGENIAAWNAVKADALKEFAFDYQPDTEIFHNERLEKAAETKAFYYLMTGDKKVGVQAVKLMNNYLSVLEFGNVSYGDITREVGRAIYTSSLVYDWCYDLLDVPTRTQMLNNMMRLAREMSIGWPPFDESVINGHGNEAQLSRDLLSMSIAIYDEDPEPYRYTSYRMLEQLAPMRKFEYQSPRHNQGVDYGAYRFGWEMHGVWLLYRMSGVSSFDDNIKELPNYWLYMRLPDGYMLRDGDMFSVKNGGTKPPFWKQPQTMLLSYAYANSALVKGEFERQGGLPENPVLFLLLNDPSLKADHNIGQLPKTKDFGPVLGSMIARTGWNNTNGSDDVIAEIKGGGYHFGNHQHADAGAIQIFYRGMQVGDLGLYLSYGSPYDLNFNKRSIAHSTLLLVDPKEQLLFRTKFRDGGARFNQRFPLTPAETVTDPWYNYGSVLCSDFGPDPANPSFSYFKVDLTPAYTQKAGRITREFCFLDLNRKDVPAVIILSDEVSSTHAGFRKYWQINTLNVPDTTGAAIELHNTLDGRIGRTYVNMLVPSVNSRETIIKSGKQANSTFEQSFDISSSKLEASGHRILISPRENKEKDRFLTVFQMLADSTAPLPVKFLEENGRYNLIFSDRVVNLSANSAQEGSAFSLSVPSDKGYQVLVTGLTQGFWHVKTKSGGVPVNYDIQEKKNTLSFSSIGGEYEIVPGRSTAAQQITPPERP
jgi:heparin/heparan-sulfate lyase